MKSSGIKYLVDVCIIYIFLPQITFDSIQFKDSVLLGNSRGSKEARARASAALHNIIHSQPDDKRGRREIRVLHLLEQIRVYCETCWEWQESHERGVDQDKNPSEAYSVFTVLYCFCVSSLDVLVYVLLTSQE